MPGARRREIALTDRAPRTATRPGARGPDRRRSGGLDALDAPRDHSPGAASLRALEFIPTPQEPRRSFSMKIGFIGIGAMGQPMLANVLKKGHNVVAYDVVEAALDGAIK